MADPEPKYVLTEEARDSIEKGVGTAALCNIYIDKLTDSDLVNIKEKPSGIEVFLDKYLTKISRTKNILQVFFQTSEAQDSINEYNNENLETIKKKLEELLTTYIKEAKKEIKLEETTAGGKKLRKRNKRSTNKPKRSNTNKRKRKTNKRSKRKHSNTNKKSRK